MRCSWLLCVSLVLFAASPALHGADTPDDAPVLTALDAKSVAKLLGDEDLAVAGKAANELARVGTPAFPALAEILKSGSPQQRWGATVAIAQSQADTSRFLPALTKQLSDPDVLIVRSSLAALTRLQSKASKAVPALKRLLSHEEAEIRWATLETLGAIGPGAAETVPAIEPFLKDESVDLRLIAAESLQRIRPPAPLTVQEVEAHVEWLRENVPTLMTQLSVPGVSIAIVHGGQVRWAQGFGVRDVRDGKPVTTDTVFEAGSLSKPIFALLVMQMVQDRSLDLDRPLVEYLGRDYLPDYPGHRRITARMALTHRTGLPNWRMGYAEMGGPLSLQYPPGSEYTYSGEGIYFLQQAIEKASGVTLEQMSQERLFVPLRLAHTSFVWNEAIEQELASGHGTDATFKERARYRAANGAYSLYTTPSEYARMLLTLLPPTARGDHTLTRTSLELMLQKELRIEDEPVLRPERSQAVATYRALGWKIDVSPDGDIVWHSGSNSSGFKTYAQLNPAKKSGVVIFANGDNGYRLREAVVQKIGDL